jgi:hypothetical protein
VATIAPGGKSCSGGPRIGLSCSVHADCPGVANGCVNDSIMEIGNAGRDLASTGMMYLRPGALGGGTSVQLFTTASRGSVAINGGNLCLRGPLGGPNPDCRRQWPVSGGGELYWDIVAETLKPKQESHLRIGTFANPLPDSSGPGLAIYANNASATDKAIKFNNGGRFCIGFVLDWCYGSTNINLGSKMSVSGNLTVDILGVDRFLTWFPTSGTGFRVWDQGIDGLAAAALGLGAGPDADTFDGNRSKITLPFTNNGNLFWKKWRQFEPGPKTIYNFTAICLHTTDSKLCKDGDRQGFPCANDSNCPNGTPGSCTNICASQNATCPATRGDRCLYAGTCLNSGPENMQDCYLDVPSECPGGTCVLKNCTATSQCTHNGPPTKVEETCMIGDYFCAIEGYCTSTNPAYNGDPCRTDNPAGCPDGRCVRKPCLSLDDCNSDPNESCLTGDLVVESHYVGAIVLPCAERCAGLIKCQGQTAEPICGSFGSQVNYITGKSVNLQGLGGPTGCYLTDGGDPFCGQPAHPACLQTCGCDCLLYQDENYQVPLLPNSGGDICTEAIRSS